MGLTFAGHSTSFQVLLSINALYSSTIACCHSLCFTASLYVEGSVKSFAIKEKLPSFYVPFWCQFYSVHQALHLSKVELPISEVGAHLFVLL